MATQALYNKWRGQTFDDILGQEHITRTLRNQIKAGRVGHAYLFTGLRGTGKTSTARILAKAVNCIGETDDPPCNRCPICVSITRGRSLDLIEIDAASNRGIDEIRDLRDGVNFSPHESRYKVHVIDEVHMLTNEAFNALLKTLEEPPAHVIFILCTTEPHRLPDTILSRCQRFDFRRASVGAVLKKLRFICAQEGITVAEDALEIIARRGGGSFRDAESLLDQLAAYGSTEITGELVQSVLGTVASALVLSLVESLVAGDTGTGLRLINEAIDNGAEPRQFLSEILDHLRALLLIRVGSRDNLYYLSDDEAAALEGLAATYAPPPGLLTRAIRLFNEASQGLRNAARTQLPLELAFIETLLQEGQLAVQEVRAPRATGTAPREQATLAKAEVETQGKPATQEVPASEATPIAETTAEEHAPRPRTVAETPEDEFMAGGPGLSAPREENLGVAKPAGAAEPTDAPKSAGAEEPMAAKKPVAEPPAAAEQPDAAPSLKLTIEWVQSRWNMVLTKVRARNPQVRALLNSAYPLRVRDNQIVLACEATFHRDMLSDDKRIGVLEEVASEVLEAPCAVTCVLDAENAHGPQAAGEPPEQRAAELFAAGPPSRAPSTHHPAATGSAAEGNGADAEDAREKLLSHPAVKRLQERGGRVVKVTLADEK